MCELFNFLLPEAATHTHYEFRWMKFELLVQMCVCLSIRHFQCNFSHNHHHLLIITHVLWELIPKLGGLIKWSSDAPCEDYCWSINGNCASKSTFLCWKGEYWSCFFTHTKNIGFASWKSLASSVNCIIRGGDREIMRRRRDALIITHRLIQWYNASHSMARFQPT